MNITNKEKGYVLVVVPMCQESNQQLVSLLDHHEIDKEVKDQQGYELSPEAVVFVHERNTDPRFKFRYLLTLEANGKILEVPKHLLGDVFRLRRWASDFVGMSSEQLALNFRG